ncbi:MAG: ribosome silencing factor [Ilumatobacteraceae bacterium]|nr:ribosome silencing factor [Ilumatobacteraceae bacterium]
MTTDQQNEIDSRELAIVAAKAADAKQADNIIVLPVGDILAITEYFVVASASNKRLVRAIADEILGVVRATTGRSPLRSEGVSEHEWILIDYGDIVVHIFGEETRRFYEIERLYKDVVAVDWR